MSRNTARTSLAEVGEEILGANFSELWVSLGDFHGDYPEARRKIEKVMARHPGFQHDLLTYLQERLKEVVGGGTGASIVLRIYGPELDGLRSYAADVENAIKGSKDKEGMVAGVADLKMEAQVLVPQLHLTFDPYKMNDYGLKPRDVGDAVTTYLNGSLVAEVHQAQRKFDIVVRGHADVVRHLPDLKRLQIDLPGGKGTIPLMAVADLQHVNAPNIIKHDKASRCIDVSCNVKGRDPGSVVNDVQERLKSVPERQGIASNPRRIQARAESTQQLWGWSIVSLSASQFFFTLISSRFA